MLLLCGPLFVVLMSMHFERGAAVSRWKLLALSGLGLGAVVACASQPRLSFDVVLGIAMGLASTTVGAAGVVLSGVLLSDGDLAPLSLLFYLSPIQAAIAGVTLPFTEAAPFLRWSVNNFGSAVCRVGIGALMQFGVQMATFSTVQRTNAVAASILGNLKSVLTIALSVALLGTHLSPSCAFGYASSIASGCLYTAITVRERSSTAAPESAASVAMKAVGGPGAGGGDR